MTKRRPRYPFPVVVVTTGTEPFDVSGWSQCVVDYILRLERSAEVEPGVEATDSPKV